MDSGFGLFLEVAGPEELLAVENHAAAGFRSDGDGMPSDFDVLAAEGDDFTAAPGVADFEDQGLSGCDGWHST